MANIIGNVVNPDNPEWIALRFDDGSLSPWAHDPSGTFRRESDEIAQKLMGRPPNPMGGAVAGPGGAGLDAAGNPIIDLDEPPAPAPVAPPRPALALTDVQPPMGPPTPPPAAPPTVIATPTPEQAAELARQQGALDRENRAHASQQQARNEKAAREAELRRATEGAPAGPVILPSGGGGIATESSVTRQTSGLSAADKAKVDADNQRAIDSAYKAGLSEHHARTQAVNDQWSTLLEREKEGLAKTAVLEQQQKRYDEAVARNTAHLREISERKIDPSQAFAGDAGWYAFMAGLGDAIANFGAALAGRGPVADPGKTIDRMIERSVSLQTAQKEQDFKNGRITADQLNADRERVRLDLLSATQQQLELRHAKEKNREDKLALGAALDKIVADRDAAIAKAAQATARQEVTSQTIETKVVPSTTPGLSGDMFLGEKPDWDGVKAHSERQAGADMMQRGVERLEKATGWTWDERANNGAGGYRGKDGQLIDDPDVSGVTALGTNFAALSGEMGREVQGAIDDIASGQAKLDDPVGAVSDKSIEAKKQASTMTTDAGVLRGAMRIRRNLRGMRAGADAAFSPGVVNASRARRNTETNRQNAAPGLPPSRAPTPSELR